MKKDRSLEDRLILEPFRDRWSAVPSHCMQLAGTSILCLGGMFACFAIGIWKDEPVLGWIGLALLLISLSIGRLILRREKLLLDELEAYFRREQSATEHEPDRRIEDRAL